MDIRIKENYKMRKGKIKSKLNKNKIIKNLMQYKGNKRKNNQLRECCSQFAFEPNEPLRSAHLTVNQNIHTSRTRSVIALNNANITIIWDDVPRFLLNLYSQLTRSYIF